MEEQSSSPSSSLLQQLPAAVLSPLSSASALANLESFRQAVRTCKRPDAHYEELKDAACKIVDLYEQQLLRYHSIEGFEAGRFRAQLERAYAECIKRFPEQASQDQLDGLLWRYCFHRPIDHYRQHIKSLKGEKTAKYAALELCQIVEQGFGSLLNLLHHLSLDASTTCLDALFATLGFPPVSTIHEMSSKATGAFSKRRRPIVYRLLVFCGDLARYRSQYSRAFRGDGFGLASLFYLKARWLLPSHGHAFNMLAVTWSLDDQDAILASLYAYTRSICCQVPFPVTRSNLQVFLRNALEKHGAPWRSFLIPLQKILSAQSPTPDEIISFAQGLEGLVFAVGRKYIDHAPLAAWVILHGLGLETQATKEASFDLLIAFAKVALGKIHDLTVPHNLFLILLLADFCRKHRTITGISDVTAQIGDLLHSQTSWPDAIKMSAVCDEMDGYLQADQLLQLFRSQGDHNHPASVAACMLSRIERGDSNAGACGSSTISLHSDHLLFEEEISDRTPLDTLNDKDKNSRAKDDSDVDIEENNNVEAIPSEANADENNNFESKDNDEEEDVILFKGFGFAVKK